MTHLRPVVLCGGAGARLWPLSRPDRPKPLLPLASERSLLTETLERVSGHRDPWLVCGAAHAAAFAAEAPGHRRVVEPTARGTAPAAIVAALLALEEDPEAVVLLAPADHAVAPIEAFRSSLERAVDAASQGHLVTFGVTPRSASTAYGWIEPGAALGAEDGARAIVSFVEKPGQAVAQKLFASGCLWNSGMFVARAERLLEEARGFVPETVAHVERALDDAVRRDGEVRLGGAFAECPAESFDVAVLQRTARGAVVPASFRWADLGTWPAVIEARGGGAQILTDGPRVRVLGHPNVLIAVTGGAVLVATPERAHEVAGFEHPDPAVLDSGPGWVVERRLVAAGTEWRGPGTAVVLAGRAGDLGPGSTLPHGAAATEPSTWLVARFTSRAGTREPPDSAGG